MVTTFTSLAYEDRLQAELTKRAQQAEDAWGAEIEKGTSFLEIQASCTPGYFNDEGKVGESEGWLGGFYPEGSEAFFALLRAWRASGKLDGLELS